MRLGAACAGLALLLAAAGTVAAATVQPLPNGIGTIDLLGDGTPAMVVTGWRENFNAHGFDVVSIYLQLADEDAERRWQLVSVWNDNDERLTLGRSGGADCLLHDLRLLPAQGREPAMLVLADRELGESFADPAPVKFSWYTLRRNDTIGRPAWYFERSREQMAKAEYCDVGEAFEQELGLGS